MAICMATNSDSALGFLQFLSQFYQAFNQGSPQKAALALAWASSSDKAKAVIQNVNYQRSHWGLIQANMIPKQVEKLQIDTHSMKGLLHRI